VELVEVVDLVRGRVGLRVKGKGKGYG